MALPTPIILSFDTASLNTIINRVIQTTTLTLDGITANIAINRQLADNTVAGAGSQGVFSITATKLGIIRYLDEIADILSNQILESWHEHGVSNRQIIEFDANIFNTMTIPLGYERLYEALINKIDPFQAFWHKHAVEDKAVENVIDFDGLMIPSNLPFGIREPIKRLIDVLNTNIAPFWHDHS